MDQLAPFLELAFNITGGQYYFIHEEKEFNQSLVILIH